MCKSVCICVLFPRRKSATPLDLSQQIKFKFLIDIITICQKFDRCVGCCYIILVVVQKVYMVIFMRMTTLVSEVVP